MRAKHVFPLLLSMFFLGACCQTDTLQYEPNNQLRPLPETSQAPVPLGAQLNNGQAGTTAYLDLVPRTLERIPVGTVVGKTAPKNWTNLLLVATPTLTEQDVRDAPKMATHYARMFKFILLANVVATREGAKTAYWLQRIARGFAIDLNGQDTVIDGKNTLGADLGLFGRRVLAENEAILDKDVYQIARTGTMLVFDAESTMLSGSSHRKMIMRHAVLVDPDTGRVFTLVWLLSKTPSGYAFAESNLQLLPPSMQEARLLHVLKDRFTLGIPSPDAFALVRIPQGSALPWTPDLERTAALGTFAREQVFGLERSLRALINQGAYAPRSPGS